MAGENEAGGADPSEVAQADPAAPAGGVAPEAGAGADGASDPQAEADRAREDYLVRVATDAATRAAEAVITRMQPAPAAPAATPPTAGQGAEDAALYAEHNAIEAERARLNAAFARDGYTGENIVAHNNLTARESRFIGQVNLVATKRQEQNIAIASQGNEKEWQEFARANPGTPIDILRDAFTARQAKAAPAAAPKPAAPAKPARPFVDTSAPGEVSAAQAKARVMTDAQATQHRNSLREAGKDDEAAVFDRKLRSREILIKG